jgi:predicted amidohydrolase YtcJ
MSKISRRDLFKAGAAAGLGAMLPGSAQAAKPQGGGAQGNQTDLTFVNGRIHTLDDKGSVVSAVAIRNGRFVGVGSAASNPGPGARVINLHGRTVVPGLLESHSHFVSLANRPGYHVVLELARNIREVQELLAARRAVGDVPEDKFITAMGGWSPNQWAERRLPTLAELDAAVPDRPVFVYQGGGGPARTNTLGKMFFENATAPLAGPVLVGLEGEIINTGGVNHPNRALYHLRIRQSFEDKKRSAVDAMAYSASVGITAVLDQTLVAVNSGTHDPATLDPLPTHGLPTSNHFRMEDGWLAVHREGGTLIRLQMNFLHNQGFVPQLGSDLASQLPELRERLKNQFQFFGDDMLRTGGIGEWAAPFATPSNVNGYAVWYEAQRLCAQARWRNENSQGSVANVEQVVSTYEAMDAEFGNLAELRWGLQHGELATPQQLQRLKALNCGLSASGFRWTSTAATPPASPVGPLFPQMIESGIRLGLHEDGVHIAPHNPWFALHYATTGLNVVGTQINAGQQISRQQALYLYTRGNAWYLNQEDKLGSIEVGKLADLVVLDRDYFSVSDAAMRETRPVLTVVDGKIVYDAGVV